MYKNIINIRHLFGRGSFFPEAFQFVGSLPHLLFFKKIHLYLLFYDLYVKVADYLFICNYTCVP